MLLDCIVLNDEIHLLESRLAYLYNHVDFFIIVESNRTPSGKIKSLNYIKNVDKFRPYLDKIIYVPFQPNSNTDLENQNIKKFEDILNLFSPLDLVLLGNIDEIPAIQSLVSCINEIGKSSSIFAFEQNQFYYNFNLTNPENWVGTVITSVDFVLKNGTLWIRSMRGNVPRIVNSGFKLNYWGTFDQIFEKIKSEYTKDISSLEKIKNRIYKFKDAYGEKLIYPFDNFIISDSIKSIFKSEYDPKILNQPNVMDHFCENVEGWFGPEDRNFYKAALHYFDGPAHFVEVGSFKGMSSSFMAVEIANSKKNIRFDCVDTWDGSPEHNKDGAFEDRDAVAGTLYDVFIKNMKPVEGYYNPVRTTSLNAATRYQNQSLDFVFIDALHDYDNVLADIKAWLPKIKKGGIISGHDYFFEEVHRAVNDTLGPTRFIGICWYYIVT